MHMISINTGVDGIFYPPLPLKSHKTRIIKEVLGKTLEKKGFKYISKEKGIIWTFVRNVNDVKEEVYIQQHSIFEREYKLIMWSSAKGNGVKEIGNVLPEYSDNEYWCAETEKEFIEVISFLISLLMNLALSC